MEPPPLPSHGKPIRDEQQQLSLQDASPRVSEAPTHNPFEEATFLPPLPLCLDGSRLPKTYDLLATARNRRITLKGAIIGSGIAGSTFARLLTDHYPNISFELFEGRQRVGGRVFTDRKESSIFERGAEFVNEDHHTMRTMCESLGVELLDTYSEGSAAPRFGILDNGELKEDVRAAVSALVRAVGRDRPLLKDNEMKAHFDGLSAQEYVSTLDCSDSDKKYILQFLENEQGIRPQRMSASFILEFMDFQTLQEGDNSFYAAGDDRYVIRNGSVSVIEALLAQCESSIHLSRTVQAIRPTSAGRYRVFPENIQPTDVDFVVLAVPGPALKRIELHDSLSHLQRKLLGLHYSDVEKVILELSGEPLQLLKEFHQVLSLDTKAIVWECPNGAQQTNRSQIALYRGGGSVGYRPKGHNSVEMIEQLISDLANAATVRSNSRHPVPHLVSQTTENWPEGGFAQPRRGRGADFHHGTPVREQNVFVVGEHMASEDPQTMEGAMESAVQAFREFEKWASSFNRTQVPPRVARKKAKTR